METSGERAFRKRVNGRNAHSEFLRNVEEGNVVFYGIGGLSVCGYSLAGLTQAEADIIVQKDWEIVREFWTEGELFAVKNPATWDAVNRFSVEYNRLVYDYLIHMETEKEISAKNSNNSLP